MKTFKLEVVTPIRIYDEGQVSYIRCPGIDGLFGVMASHTKALFALSIGEIKVTKDHQEELFATSGGYAEITRDKVQLLLETVEKSQEIDASRAEQSINRAKERLASTEAEIDRARAKASLTRALNRLSIAERKF